MNIIHFQLHRKNIAVTTEPRAVSHSDVETVGTSASTLCESECRNTYHSQPEGVRKFKRKQCNPSLSLNAAN